MFSPFQCHSMAVGHRLHRLGHDWHSLTALALAAISQVEAT
jgi:hypothetical protein